MSNLIRINNEYANWIKDLSLRFRQSQMKAAVKVNRELLKFYFVLGADIVNKQAESKWGEGFFRNLSQDLRDALPDVKGLSETNLKYTKYFYLLYSPLIEVQNASETFSSFHPQLVDDSGKTLVNPQSTKEIEKHPQLVDELETILSIPWGHHRFIIDKCNGDTRKALFYVQQTIKYNWSRSMLLNFLDSDLFERQGKAVTNFEMTLPDAHGDLAQQLLKDPYCFDFVQLTDRFNEKELKDELVTNVERFLLETGNGFAYMGREHRMLVGETELFCDMLFYNTYLHCYVIVEVKTTKFDNAFLGQLSGYVSSANHLLRREGDNPTIGLLICKSKDNVLARYALEGYSQPLGISEYELSKLYPAEFKGTLPSIEEIERELKNK